MAADQPMDKITTMTHLPHPDTAVWRRLKNAEEGTVEVVVADGRDVQVVGNVADVDAERDVVVRRAELLGLGAAAGHDAARRHQ